jgi:hypothetical protein
MNWFANVPDYEFVRAALVVAHIGTALLSLVIAPLAMLVQKGGVAHRRWGKLYFWAMFVANGAALALLFWRFNLFLLGVTVISFYGALSGYRVLFRKRPPHHQGATWLDWGVAWLVLAAGASLALSGALTALGLINQHMLTMESGFVFFVVLPLLFGIIIAQTALADLHLFRHPELVDDHQWWWYYHMERMIGSYTGLVTAFMVQTAGRFLPESIVWIAWVTPPILSTPLITYWIGRHRQQFAQRRQTMAVSGHLQ